MLRRRSAQAPGLAGRAVSRLLPSPAMVVALIALAISLGGSATAFVITGKSIKNGSVTGRDIRNGSLTYREVRRDSLGGHTIKESSLGPVPTSILTYGSQRFAVVTGGGHLERGRGVTSAARTSEGRYQVIFNGDVRSCAYFATLGDHSAGNPPQNSQIAVSSLASNINGVDVRTENGSNGAELNRDFHLIVFC
jgi:hypothetical protein